MIARIFLLVLAGATAALSLPDSGIGTFVYNPTPWSFPVFAGAIGYLFIALRQARSSIFAALCGYLWALGYFTAGLSWVANALLIDGNPYAWAYPIALFGLPALLSLFLAAVFGAGHRLIARSREQHAAILFVVLFTISEWARGTLFTGFPWLLPAMYWSETPMLFHGIGLIGIYALTGLTILWAMASFQLARRRSPLLIGFAFVSFAGLCGYEIQRTPDQESGGTPLHVVLVQANIPQSEKWNGAHLIDHFYTHLELSKRPTGLKDDIPTVIIWPETAIPPSFVNAPVVRDQIARLLKTYPKNSVLLTGALRAEMVGEQMHFYNSALIYDANGGVIATYDKSHLVPFGEYMPFQKYIPVGPIAQFEGLQSGPGPQILSAPGLPPVAPLICYEVIFPGITHGLKPAWIASLTNDSWYGNTAGPRQHLALARAKAIETGRPVVRVAGSGISALIRADGSVATALPYGETGSASGYLSLKTYN